MLCVIARAENLNLETGTHEKRVECSDGVHNPARNHGADPQSAALMKTEVASEAVAPPQVG